ncbi:MAG TPA: hypothetical protein VFW33_00130 [Gemmataceae bacterium]|nr:hypothetical protein [Gemmataceae bacterium]
MRPTEPARARALLWWCVPAVLLLAWNGVVALYASPTSLLQGHDGAQYHLLVRNRLHGHYEPGDEGHTVRAEGQHPIWRPGLVWIEEGLARAFGSVAAGAAAAGALGTTLLGLALLALARACFDRATALVVLAVLLLPLTASVQFLRMSVGQGPEPWAAAALTAGLAALAVALRRRSWAWGLAAGALAGSCEWFRAGSYLLFAVPCAVYALPALRRRDWPALAVPALAVVGFGLLTVAAGRLVASPVDKTAVALIHRMQERDGPKLLREVAGGEPVTVYLGGLVLPPDGDLTNCDQAVRDAHTVRAAEVFRARRDDVLASWLGGLRDIVTTGFRGLRLMVGPAVLIGFLLTLALALARRRGADLHVLALGAGVAAHYFGPVALLRGNDPTHYLLVVLPLVLVIAARFPAELWQAALARLERARPGLARVGVRLGAVPVLLVLGCIAAAFYGGALDTLRESRREADESQRALDSLGLEGRRIACRSMSWFADRDVRPMLLPYCSVRELERYVAHNRLDGVLIWHGSKEPYFTVSPEGQSFDDLRAALSASPAFGEPSVAGEWYWYPTRVPALISQQGPSQ